MVRLCGSVWSEQSQLLSGELGGVAMGSVWSISDFESIADNSACVGGPAYVGRAMYWANREVAYNV